MKKQYIIPSISIVEVQLESLIAVSVPFGGSTDAESPNEARFRDADILSDDEADEELW